LSAACSDAPGPPPESLGVVQDRAVPPSVGTIPLFDQHGHRTDLDALRGRVALVAPFMTLCSEMCPITTGELESVVRALRADGDARYVSVVELSIDPGRDTPERIAAYASMAGVGFTLLTTTPPTPSPPSPLPVAPASAVANLNRIAGFFGWLVQKVPQSNPPAVDWWSGKPLTYDVDHSDGFVLLSPSGRVRFETVAPATTGGRLKEPLKDLLDPTGLHNLADPGSGAWSVGGRPRGDRVAAGKTRAGIGLDSC